MRCSLLLHNIVKKKHYIFGGFLFFLLHVSHFSSFEASREIKCWKTSANLQKNNFTKTLCSFFAFVLYCSNFFKVLMYYKEKILGGGFFHSTDFLKLCIVYFFFFL